MEKTIKYLELTLKYTKAWLIENWEKVEIEDKELIMFELTQVYNLIENLKRYNK